MKNTSYQNTIKLFTNSGPFLNPQDQAVETYEFHTLELNGSLDEFAEFCQESLNRFNNSESDNHLFVYTDEIGINAYKCSNSNTHVVCISIELFREIREHLLISNCLFYANNSDILNLNFNKSDISLLMYQTALNFIFYHETAHIYHSKNNKFNEVTSLNKPFSLANHVLEYDADIFSANTITFHLFDYFESLTKTEQTVSNLENIISLGLSSVFILFVFLHEEEIDFEDLKTLENTQVNNNVGNHPTTITRITYIIDQVILISNADSSLPSVEAKNIVHQLFKLVECFYDGDNILMNILSILESYDTQIMSHIEKLLLEAHKNPSVIKRREILDDKFL